MSKTAKNTVDYFYHPVKDGDRMAYMEETFGDKGYVAYYKLLQRLGRAEGHYLDFDDTQVRLFYQKDVRADVETLDRIMMAFVDLRVIDRELYIEHQIVWCQEFVDRLAEVYRKRGRVTPLKPSNCDSLRQIKEQEPDADAEMVQSKVKESKAEESKGKKDSRSSPDLSSRKQMFSNLCRSGEFKDILDPEELEKFIAFWVESNPNAKKFKKEMQKVFDIKRRMNTWKSNNEKWDKTKRSNTKQGDKISSVLNASEKLHLPE